MKMTREQMIRYWASEPKIKLRPPDTCDFNAIPFPDLCDLGPEEKVILRDILARHPEYLQEVVVFGEGVGLAVIQ
jgi:hypothetical protein